MAGKSLANVHWDRGFVNGVAIALGILNSSHDQPSMCAEVLRATNLNRAKMKRAGVDSYDLELLRPVFKELK